jgi:hypothetical protein
MTAAYIFFLHIVLVVYAFFSRKKESVGDGFLAAAFVVIVFAVGWTISTMITNFLFAMQWFDHWFWQPLESRFWQIVRREINRDTLSLLILTAGEVAFYYLYFAIGDKNDTTEEKKSEK